MSGLLSYVGLKKEDNLKNIPVALFHSSSNRGLGAFNFQEVTSESP